jgi:replicative DNA helicase
MRADPGGLGGNTQVTRAVESRSSDAAYDRTPPQDVPAEQSALGGMLLSKDAIADVVEVVRPTDFYRPAHQLIYDAILDLYARGEPADAVTVSAELTRAGQLMRIGGAEYLVTLIQTVPTAANAGYYAQIVAEKAVLRRLVTAGTRIVQMGYDTATGASGITGSVDDVVDRAQAEIYDVTERRTSDDYVHIEALLSGTLTEIERIADSGGIGTGIPTGFARLDEITNGLHPGQMITVAGRPGSGKALAVDTPLATPTGWTTMGEVEVGDELLDADGRPTRVVAATGVLRGRPCYEVEFSDGTVIVADAQHEWRTSTRASVLANAGGVRESQDTIFTTEQIARTIRCGTVTNHRVACTAPLALPRRALPLPPYVLGAWLGRAHPHDRQGTLEAQLRTMGVLARKHIPMEYLRASEAQRRALLAGLLDAEGTVTPSGNVTLTASSKRLGDDIRELLASLGYRPTPRAKPGCAPGAGYTIAFTPGDQVFRLSRRANRLASTTQRTAHSRQIVAVRVVRPVPVRCVQVDNADHMYLAGRTMVPTHNSTLALDFARSAAVKHHKPTVVFSLEMGKLEIMMRLFSAEALVPLRSMRSGHMSDQDWARLARRSGELAEAPLFIDDSPNLTMMEIRAKARRLRQRHDLQLIVIDYLQLMTSGKRVESRQQEVSEFSRAIKLLAKELDVPVVALSQLNRGPEQRTDKKPMLADLRESGSIEQDSDVVLLVHREDMYERESPRAGEADLIIAKHRNGPTATVAVSFQGHYSRFSDMPE